MKTYIRRQEMLQHISARKTVKISELKELFNVSEVTIRNDLDHLEQEGKVKRTHGKASFTNGDTETLLPDTPLIDSKTTICKHAMKFVSPGDTLFLDSSATSIVFSSFIQEIPNITVITNCLAIINRLKHLSHMQLYAIPGLYNTNNHSFTGPLAESFISNLKTAKAFISPKGILEDGLRDKSAEEGAIRRSMIQSSKQTIVLADYSKFENYEEVLFQISDFTKVGTIITDRKPPASFYDIFHDHQVQLVVAKDGH